jgi:hypothetical protein
MLLPGSKLSFDHLVVSLSTSKAGGSIRRDSIPLQHSGGVFLSKSFRIDHDVSQSIK